MSNKICIFFSRISCLRFVDFGSFAIYSYSEFKIFIKKNTFVLAGIFEKYTSET